MSDKETNQKREIVFKLWEALNLLRSEIRSEDYDVILYLLVLYRKAGKNSNILSEFTDRLSLIEYSFLNIIETNSVDLLKSQFERKLDSLTKSHIKTIINSFGSVHFDKLDKFFPEIFEAILYRIASERSKEMGTTILPRELLLFLKEILEIPKFSNIYNPFAGLASFSLIGGKRCKYYGQEINQDTWALGQLRIIAHNLESQSNYTYADSVNHWPLNQYFDLIISSPPFGYLIKSSNFDLPDRVRNSEEFVIERGLESLKEKGKLAVIVSAGFLHTSLSKKMRKYLVETNYLKKVIHLPEGILFNTGIGCAILVLSKKRDNSKNIQLIDGTNFIKDKNYKHNTFEYKALCNAINENDKTYSQVVDRAIIENKDYSLHPARYFQNDIAGIKLKKILKRLRGKRITESIRRKVVTGKDLGADVFNSQLDSSSIDEKEIKHVYEIDQSCLLVNFRSPQLAFSYFKYEGESIYVHNFIPAFTIKEEQVMPIYLTYTLASDKVKSQVKSLRKGLTTFDITYQDFLKIKVDIPSVEEQKTKIESINSLYSEFKELQSEKETIVNDLEKSSYNEFASLKHTLGTPRQEILSYSKSLLKYFGELDSSVYDSINKNFSARYRVGLLEVFQAINRNINLISEILEKGEKGLVLENFPLEYISLDEIEQLCESLKGNNYKFNVSYNGLALFDNDQDYSVLINKALLEILFQNILENANKHGFAEGSSENELVLELEIIESNLVLTIKNNGTPFPRNFSKDKFIRKFSTSNPKDGKGLGGYDINRIAKCFGNKDWDLILNNSSLYPVKFIFTLPLKANN